MTKAQDIAFEETIEAMDALGVELKILHILSIYPIISPTMLQAGLGPSTKAVVWRPILAKLIEDGLVIESRESLQTPTDRYNTYNKVRLATTKDNVRGI